jgi:hypothetical protein
VSHAPINPPLAAEHWKLVALNVPPQFGGSFVEGIAQKDKTLYDG